MGDLKLSYCNPLHQKQVLVERFQRKSDNLWLPQVFRAGEQVVFESVGFRCEIAELYENLEQLSQ